MDDLIRWSVTTPGIITIFIIALAIALLSLIPNQQGRKEIAWIMRFLAVFIMTLPMLTMIIDSQGQPIETTTEWRTIYNNDIDAQVELSMPTNDLFSVRKYATAGSELGHNYNAFESASNGVIIKAIKNNTVVSKTVKLPQENIIINGQLNEYAKIIKIEYRETTKEFKYYTGTFNEIKVTIDGTKTAGDKEELEGLFK